MQNSFVLCAMIALLSGAFHVSATSVVGARRCTWGPSYWCNNLTTAKDCHAVQHCIQTVWEKQQVPADNDSICQICKDMVTQARDQLRSNETMEELKEVFEGSCNLIPIKIVKKECSKLADDFVPELVEALSSQMNPDQVCTVSGLCNNAEIDKLLMSYYQSVLDGTLAKQEGRKEVIPSTTKKPTTSIAPQQHLLTCSNCNHLGSLITEKFNKASRDEILENTLHICGQMSSFSDACSNIVLTYFNDIYDHVKKNLNAAGICHMSGSCAAKYHKHADDPKEEEDLVALSSTLGDDIPCKLCAQLVQHLRDMLVANTTEAEFKQILYGLCNQTKGFREECDSIVEQYYDVIYNSLVNNLDYNGACVLIGVCPRKNEETFKGEIRPMLPAIPVPEIKVTIRKLGANEPKFTQEEIHSMALPIDTLMGAANPELLVEKGELCPFCEYVLHYIQVELASPSTEEQVKKTVSNVCNRLGSLRRECHRFIDIYGDAVIALLIQGLNPREICPKLQMCAPNHDTFDDVDIFAPILPTTPAPKGIIDSGKPTCPLCLFAVEQAQAKIKNNRSKENIKSVLGHLCSHLPTELKSECVDLVNTYSNELIDMLVADFRPQEICVDLKLCPKSNDDSNELEMVFEDNTREDAELNEVNTSDSVEVEFGHIETPNCLLCMEFIKIAEKKIGKHTTKADIKKALDHSCDKLRKNAREQCHKFVSRYGDKIAELLEKEMEPKIICRELALCLWSEQEDLEIDEALKYDIIVPPDQKNIRPGSVTDLDSIIKEPPVCVMCEFIISLLEKKLQNKTAEDEIKHTIERVCHIMPQTVRKSCDAFMNEYVGMILSLMGTVPPKQLCSQMHLCYAGLDVISDQVIECGVCHGATSALLPYFKQHLDHDSITENYMLLESCEALPAKYYDICSRIIRIYGRSILHLAEKGETDEARICAKIGKCFNNEKSSLAFARISA